MPLVRLQTSQKIGEAQQKEVLSEISSFISRALGKPESYVMTMFGPSVPMTFGGTDQPALFIEVKSIGNLDAKRTKAVSEGLCALAEKKLGVQSSRVYIEFTDAKANLWAWDGSTFG